jgi:hypothetical protein
MPGKWGTIKDRLSDTLEENLGLILGISIFWCAVGVLVFIIIKSRLTFLFLIIAFIVQAAFLINILKQTARNRNRGEDSLISPQVLAVLLTIPPVAGVVVATRVFVRQDIIPALTWPICASFMSLGGWVVLLLAKVILEDDARLKSIRLTRSRPVRFAVTVALYPISLVLGTVLLYLILDQAWAGVIFGLDFYAPGSTLGEILTFAIALLVEAFLLVLIGYLIGEARF